MSVDRVRKVLRSQATAFRYERVEQPQPKLGAYRQRLEELLEDDAGKTRRERLTLTRLFEALQVEGYEGRG